MDAMIAIVKQGQREGAFRPADPELIAPAVNAVLQVQLAGLLERTEDPDADALADQVLVPILRLLGAPGFEATLRFGSKPVRAADRKVLAEELRAAMSRDFMPME